MDDLAPGRILDGRFELLERLPREAGDVWLALDTELGERVVAKILPRGASPEALDRLKRRVRDLRKLRHPNIVPVYELHRLSEAVFVTEPEVDGEPLTGHRGRGLRAILSIGARIAAALDAAHRNGVAHGALRASNVLVDASGEPRLTDFALDENDASSEGEDVRALGVLLDELLSGSPRALPLELEDLLTAMTDPRAIDRPAIDSVRETLERLESRPAERPPAERERKIALTPPPRVSGPVTGGSGDFVLTRPKRARGGSVGGLTMVAFLVLIGLAGGVFLVLPDWVAKRAPAAPEAATSAAAEPPPLSAAAPEDLESLAPVKTKAERARASAVELVKALEARGAADWDGASLRSARDEIERADALMARRSYAEATERFEASRKALETIEGRASGLAREAVQRGESALASGRSGPARESFELALRIEPGNGGAKRGLARAESLDEVLGLVAAGEERERAKDLRGAAELYRKAAALDPLSPAAANALGRVDAKAAEAAFRTAMSEGMRALESKDYLAARAAFERAKAIRPGAPEVAQAIAQTAEAEKLAVIAGHREAALADEAEEAWRKAETEYRAVLDIDPTIRFAIEGAERAERYAALHEKLDFQLAHSERLSDAAALDEAKRLVEEAASTDPGGRTLARKAAALGTLVATYSTLVPVAIVSDNETEVTVYRVGRLGRFDRRALELRPGTYTVVGSRDGYRDVRHELVVRADEPPEPLVVRCEEKI